MTRKLLFLWALLITFCTSVSAQNWTWTGETPSSGNSYYIYTTKQNKFLNDNNGLDATPNILWTIGGTFASNYTLTSSYSKQFAMYRSGNIFNYSYNVVTNATNQSGNNVNLSSALTDGKYSIYRNNTTNWSGGRNVVSTSTGITRQSDASYEWYFITESQVAAKDAYLTAWNELNKYSGEQPITIDLKNRIATALTEAVNYSNYTDKVNAMEALETEYDNYIASLSSATKESPKDVSGLIKNPGYEAATWNDGWDANGFVDHENGGKFSGSHAPEMWCGENDLSSGKISQKLQNLPVGTYLLSATVTGGFDGKTSIYAIDEDRKQLIPGINGDPVQKPVAPFVIHDEAEGQEVEIGFKRDACRYWTAVDDWTLSYYPTTEYEWVNGTRLDGSYLSKPAYTGTPMEGADPEHANDALLVVTWRDNYTNDLKTPWALVPGSKAEIWTDGAKVADADLLTDFRSSHYDNGFGLYIPNFDETKTYTVKVPENVFGYTAVGHGNEAFEINAVQSPLKDGKYFVVVKGTGKHVSRGKGWGTQAILDYYGVPMLVQTAGLTTFKFLDNNAFLGSDPSDDWIFTDIQGSEGNKVRRYVLIAGEGAHEGEFQFYAPARDKYLSHVQNSIAGESYDAVNEGGNADYFQFEVLDAEGYAAHLATIEEDEAIRVAARAGFVVKNKTEYDELIDMWESKGYNDIFPITDAQKQVANKYFERKNEELACAVAWEGTPRDLVGGDKVSLSLDKGLYVMHCDAFQQAMNLATLQANQGFRGLTYMYVKVGNEMYKSQLKSITETTGTVPTDEASAIAALDSEAEIFANKVIFYVPADGTAVEFGVENPQRLGNGVDETAGSWVAFKNIKVEKFNAELDEANLTCKAGMYGTFVAPFDVILPDEIIAMKATQEFDNRIRATQIALDENNTLTAGTPVIVKNMSETDIIDKIYRDVKTVTDETVTDGTLTGALVADKEVPTGSFVLQTQQDLQAFYIVVKEKPFTCTKNRCYVNAKTSGSQAKVINIVENDDATGIVEVEKTNNKPEATVIYDLSGRRVNVAQKGIYIINGKKIVK